MKSSKYRGVVSVAGALESVVLCCLVGVRTSSTGPTASGAVVHVSTRSLPLTDAERAEPIAVSSADAIAETLADETVIVAGNGVPPIVIVHLSPATAGAPVSPRGAKTTRSV